MSWYFFAFLAPFLWAITNHIDKYVLGRYMKNADSGVLAIFAGIAGLLFSLGILIFAPQDIWGMVDMTYSSEWQKVFQELVASGVHVRTYSADAPLYIHAKMILVDEREAFVGSENFSFGSLESNRELGIVLTTPNIVSQLENIFSIDWQNATPYP